MLWGSGPELAFLFTRVISGICIALPGPKIRHTLLYFPDVCAQFGKMFTSDKSTQRPTVRGRLGI